MGWIPGDTCQRLRCFSRGFKHAPRASRRHRRPGEPAQGVKRRQRHEFSGLRSAPVQQPPKQRSAQQIPAQGNGSERLLPGKNRRHHQQPEQRPNITRRVKTPLAASSHWLAMTPHPSISIHQPSPCTGDLRLHRIHFLCTFSSMRASIHIQMRSIHLTAEFRGLDLCSGNVGITLGQISNSRDAD